MRYVGFHTLLLSIVLLAGCTHEAPSLALAAAGGSSTPEDWCKAQGGTVQSYVPKNPEAPTIEQPMCVFRNPDGTKILISTTTLAAPHATLASVAYVNRPPAPDVDGAINPAAAYCLALGGKTDPKGWVPTDNQTTRPIPLCVFSDNSIIDTWGLASRASSPPVGPDLTYKFRYRSPSPSPSPTGTNAVQMPPKPAPPLPLL
ncbi:DUF333 domain-containing protein [Acrocarpospora pleiomorpha]|uniref:DUF333 domain-containing protein n=1 Tax=Acrocarpospora pleiomorpha TaxID=90975 RepID=UPI0031D46902